VLRAQIRLGLNLAQSIRDAGPALQAQLAAAPHPGQQQPTPHQPTPTPSAPPAPVPVPAPAPAPPPSQPPQPPRPDAAAAAAAAAQRESLLAQLKLISPEQMAALPAEQRAQVEALLRAQ